MTQLHTDSKGTAESISAAPAASAPSEDMQDTGQGEGRTRVPWYAAMLCRVGIHTGRWEYLAEGQCTQMRECRRCAATKVRTKHQREWRYARDGRCEQIRTCKRCNAVSGERTKHQWGENYTVANWREGHRCKRCGVVETWDTSYDD
ncbi:MAG: hypothetical protein HY532_05380 [Chloroflexi bacterium]|nr:hypothetical protein [Chloroflexota bacterium]